MMHHHRGTLEEAANSSRVSRRLYQKKPTINHVIISSHIFFHSMRLNAHLYNTCTLPKYESCTQIYKSKPPLNEISERGGRAHSRLV
jgi:hypothetical protein